ncbi:MAG: phytanoyl-CoA dioxygenase family protein [Steroidobacteraceae bacterium]
MEISKLPLGSAVPALTDAQRAQYWRDGFVVAQGAVTAPQLKSLNRILSGWVEESRSHSEPFGLPCLDGRARFDMGHEHSAQHPALRRVNNPSEISPEYEEVIRSSTMVDMVAALIGPDVKFHHCKINSKLSGSKTAVAFHQDFCFTPHTNYDLVTALLMLDEVTPDNGALTVIPGSHTGPLYSLYRSDDFAAKVAPELEARFEREQVPVIGEAGSVCLMHTRLVHGSEINRSSKPRSLYICAYSAADAIPLSPNPLPNRHEGMPVRGCATRFARIALDVDRLELPARPRVTSFFAIQGQRSAG